MKFSRIESYKLSLLQREKINLLRNIKSIVFFMDSTGNSSQDVQLQELLFETTRFFSTRETNKLSKILQAIRSSKNGNIEAINQIEKMIEKIQESSKSLEIAKKTIKHHLEKK